MASAWHQYGIKSRPLLAPRCVRLGPWRPWGYQSRGRDGAKISAAVDAPEHRGGQPGSGCVAERHVRSRIHHCCRKPACRTGPAWACAGGRTRRGRRAGLRRCPGRRPGHRHRDGSRRSAAVLGLGRPRDVALVGAVATACAVLSAAWNQNIATATYILRAAVVAVGSVVAVLASARRETVTRDRMRFALLSAVA